MRLRVHCAPDKDVYRDIVRIPEKQRVDRQGRIIPEGKVCRVSADAKASRFLVVRGVEGIAGHSCAEPCIHMDYVTRRHLTVQFEQSCEFCLKPVRWWGELRWAWNATEIGYRISSRLAVLGFALGFLGLILAIAPLAGCGMIGKNGGMTPDQLLTHKIQCAQQGREFWKANQDFYTGDNIAFHTEWFTYSPRLNTCILYEDQHTKAEGEIQYFVDILTGRNIMPVSITAKGQIDGESPKTLYELFREANVDVRVDSLEVYMKSRREAK